MEARKEQGEKQRLQHHQEDEVKKKRHQKQVIEMEKMKEHLTATHQAVRSKIGEDVAEQLQRQLLLDHQKNEVGKLKQDELLRQRGLAKAIAMDHEQRWLREDQKLAEERLKEAERLEEQATIAAAKAEKMAKEAKSKAEKEAAEKAKKQALMLARKEKENRLRQRLDTAIKSRDVTKLEPAIAEVKKEKVPDCVEQLSVAQRLLAQLKAKSNLNNALVARQLQRLEKAMKEVKDGKFEEGLKQEMLQANGLLEKLRRLEDMKREVINLNQQMVAEIKSYKQPPLVVHQVMTATFLLLGNSEAQMHSWPATQVLIGKTGKEGLKRRVSACDVANIPVKVARRAKQLLDSHDIDSVREASQGCATFYAWAMCMVDERMSRPN
ncbi:tropomyosin-like isoform X2 [Dysidea avara]